MVTERTASELYAEHGKRYYEENKVHISERRKKLRLENLKFHNERARAGKNKTKAKTRTLLKELKSNPCFDCKQVYPSYIMDFDHRDRSKKRKNVGRMVQEGYSVEVILKEIEKCDLVCCNCHRLRSFKENTPTQSVNPKTIKGRSKRTKIAYSAKSKPCQDCARSFPHFVMDFDHRLMETKSFSISGVLSSISLSRLEAEIEKCDVVCANCHRERTHNQLKTTQNRT